MGRTRVYHTRIPQLTTQNDIKEALEVRLGRRGDPMDRAVTLRDLVDSDLDIRAFRKGATYELGKDEKPDGTVIPDKPMGFIAQPQFGGINLLWDLSSKHFKMAYAEIYRGTKADGSDRSLLATSKGSTFFDVLDEKDETTYYYWVRFHSVTDHVGPLTGPEEASVLPLVSDVIDRIEGEITETELSDELNTRIDVIERDITDLDTGLYEEIEERKTADEQMIEKVDKQVANLEGSISSVTRRVNTEVERIDGRITSTASAVDTVQSNLESGLSSVRRDMNTRAETVDGKFRGVANDINEVQTKSKKNIAAVKREMTTEIDEVDDTVKSMYTLRVQSGDKISGFGLSNDGSQSDFAVIADRFAIVHNYGSTKTSPFFVERGTVYMKTAMIKDATIQEGQLGPISIGKLEDSSGRPITTVAGKIRANAVDTDNLHVAEAAKFSGDVKSRSFRNGSRGWALWQNGDFQANNAKLNNMTASGVIKGSSIKGSTIEGSLFSGSSFVSPTEAGRPYLGTASLLQWDDRFSSYGNTYSDWVDIRSYDYRDTNHYRRFRRRKIDGRVDVSLQKPYDKVAIKVYDGYSKIVDTGIFEGNETGSGYGWSASSGHSTYESCTDTCAGQQCSTHHSEPHMNFVIDGLPYSGNSRLRFQVYTQHRGSVSASVYAKNDY
ncbi:phage tail tip fiber protein [Vreelandella jeotgali]|uniref:phage tail tip fiber protein n=1 Tax=Vreelandella jeotgali TaxID=553386 RepID=UPI00034D5782|nr:DUF1983 domain-containing protein [Halomonas jeotgali]